MSINFNFGLYIPKYTIYLIKYNKKKYNLINNISKNIVILFLDIFIIKR